MNPNPFPLSFSCLLARRGFKQLAAYIVVRCINILYRSTYEILPIQRYFLFLLYFYSGAITLDVLYSK